LSFEITPIIFYGLYDTPFSGFGEVKALGRTIRWKINLHGEMVPISISSLRVLWYMKVMNIDHVQSMKFQRRSSYEG
jgi:hypothetical protein